MSGTGAEPQWLDAGTGEDQSVRTVSRVRTSGASRPVAILAGLVLIGLLASLVIADRVDEPAEPERSNPTEPADDERSSPPSASPATGASARLTAEPDSIGTVFRMVIKPRAVGDGSVLLTIDPDAGSSVTPLPDLSRFEFDATGAWLAGLSVTRWGDQRRVLSGGPAGRSLEPLAFDVMAFAWHDTEPGLIAFSGPDRNSVSVMDLTRNEPARTVALPVEGVVGGWGDWGFAVETSSPTTAIVAPDGMLLHDGIPGAYRGTSPDGRLVMRGRRRGVSFAVDPVNGRTDRLDSLRTDAFVWRIVDAGGSDRAVAYVSRSALRGDRYRGSIYSIDAGGRLDHVGAVYAIADVDISADATIAIFAQRAKGNRSASINALIGDELTAIPLASAGGWVAAISVP